MKFKRTKKESIQPTVKIDKLLYRELKEWLKTDEAKALGFHSIAYLITTATRDLMWRYRVEEKRE